VVPHPWPLTSFAAVAAFTRIFPSVSLDQDERGPDGSPGGIFLGRQNQTLGGSRKSPPERVLQEIVQKFKRHFKAVENITIPVT